MNLSGMPTTGLMMVTRTRLFRRGTKSVWKRDKNQITLFFQNPLIEHSNTKSIQE